MTSPFRLETFWRPAEGSDSLSYTLRLTNRSGRAVSGFSLCLSGPARIDPAAVIEGATLTARLSNHSEFTPGPDLELAPGATWTIVARGLSYPLRHWTDGAATAYVALADGSTARVAIAPTHSAIDNAPLKRGTERFPVPASVTTSTSGTLAPVPVSVIPWPESVAVSGRRAVPAGVAPKGDGVEAGQAIAAFAELTAALFPAEGIVRPEAEGGLAVNLAIEPGFGPEAYRIAFAQDGVAVRAGTRTGLLYGLITLGQIWRGATRHPETFAFPTGGEIQDSPAHGWRGSHLDVARQFYASAEVARFLQLLAWSKMNRFHWHLSDDEAKRLAVRVRELRG